ncbi:MAG: GGDEF domain-containing protein, partial [Pseudomonadota bacterium]
ADRRSKTYALMHLDLDFFKSVNDTYGHAAGDCVLEKVGIILREQVRSDDLVARVGGDEFVLVFNNCDDVGLMQRIAQRIIARLEEPISFEGNTCRISGSIGITLSSYYADPSPTRMMAEADAALYASKKNGRSRATVAARPASEDV